MVIHCLFLIRRGPPESICYPELLVAWDEHQVRENADGWDEDCSKALKEIDDEVERFAYVDLDVKDAQLEKQIFGTAISAVVRSPKTKKKRR